MAVLNSQNSSTMALSNMTPPAPLPLIFWLSLPKAPLLSLPADCPDPHPCACQDQRPDGAQQGERVSNQQNSSERWVYPDSPCPTQWQYLLYCQHLFSICGNSLLPLLPFCPSVPAGSGARSSLQELPDGCITSSGQSALAQGLWGLVSPTCCWGSFCCCFPCLSMAVVKEGPLHAESEGLGRAAHSPPSTVYFLPLLPRPPKAPLNTDPCCFFPSPARTFRGFQI